MAVHALSKKKQIENGALKQRTILTHLGMPHRIHKEALWNLCP